MTLRAKMLVVAVICVAMLTFSAPVFADSESPAENAYGGEANNQQVSTSSLPFTGIDTTLVAVIGVGLLGTGFVVRRAIRSS